jgi:hypothetical protein
MGDVIFPVIVRSLPCVMSRDYDPTVVLAAPASMRAPICGHARVELVALVSFHSSQGKKRKFEGIPPPSRLVFVRIYPRQFCHKQQRPNSTLQLFNFCKPRSVLRALACSVSPVHLLSFSTKSFLKKKKFLNYVTRA